MRPYGISVLFGALARPAAVVFVQTAFSIAAWSWLLVELKRALAQVPSAGVVVVGFVACASVGGPVSRWDRTVLSESLVYSLIASFGAVVLVLRRRNFDRRTLAAAVALLVAAALIRETVLLLIGVPVTRGLAIGRPGRVAVRGARVAVALIVLAGLGAVALKPSAVVYGPQRQSLANFRSMNLVGMRILTDPYLRSRMERQGLPRTDASLHLPRFAMTDDWLLDRSPGLLAFANDF